MPGSALSKRVWTEARRPWRSVPPRRPWALIAACLVLVVLTAMLWMKWSDSRRNAARLEKELTRVYKKRRTCACRRPWPTSAR
jgi:hypothetical protein